MISKIQVPTAGFFVPNWASDTGRSIAKVVVNILNNNSPQVTAQINNEINIDIDIQLIRNLSIDIKGEANYLLEETNKTNQELVNALQKIIQFSDDAKTARNSGEVREKGWGRKLKTILHTIGSAG